MNKQEICNKLVTVCNCLNDTTVTGVKNAANIAGCHSVLQEVLTFLLNCEIILAADKQPDRDAPEKEGEPDG